MGLGLSFITELMIAGFGAVVWVVLLFSVVTGIDVTAFLWSASDAKDLSLKILGFFVITYILGMVMDRLMFSFGSIMARSKFGLGEKKLEEYYKNNVLYAGARELYNKKHSIDYIKIEKFIRCRYDVLNEKISHNKSRMIICQAWAASLFLIFFTLVVSLFLGNRGVSFLEFRPELIIWTVLAFAVIMLTAARWLTRDYQRDLLCSLSLIMAEEEKKNAAREHSVAPAWLIFYFGVLLFRRLLCK